MKAARWRLPKALLLDIDNTVYAYAPCHTAGLREAFEESHGLALWQEEQVFVRAYDAARGTVKKRIHQQAAGHSRLLYFKEMTETFLGFSSFDHICRLEQAYWRGFATKLSPDPDCCSVLAEAEDSGIRLAWVSNFTTARQIWKLKRLGLDRVRALLVTSEEAGADKPHPAILDLALSRLGIDQEELVRGEAWLVGDEMSDVDVARLREIPILHFSRDGASGAANQRSISVSNWQEIREVFRHARN